MESLQLLVETGFSIATRPEVLLAALIGGFVGTLVGVLPGIGPVGGAAIVLPFTFEYDPVIAIVMIAGIYLGSQYGNSTTAVLLRIPGEPSAVPATLDGHEMARKGRAGVALSIMAVGSWVAGTISLVIVMLSSPALADFSLTFGSAEFFALTAGGLVLLARMSGGSLLDGLLPMAIGVALTTVGTHPSTGISRFTFGISDMMLGISIVPVAVGIYGLTEMAMMLEEEALRAPKVRLRELLPTRQEWRRCFAPWGRGTLIGFFLGLFPVPSATLGAFAAYEVEKGMKKHGHEVGTGSIEGVAAPEAANNGAAIGSMVPLLVFGLPFSVTLALALAALQVQGVTPGPRLITERPEIFWGVIASMYIANVMLLILNLPMVGLWVRTLQIPRAVLLPVLVLFAFIGTYSVHNSMFDVRMALVLGVVGYVLRKLDLSIAAMLIGVVLGPLVERFMLEGLFIGRGDWTYFVGTPVSAGIWVLVLLALLWKFLPARLRGRFRRTSGPALDTSGAPETWGEKTETQADADARR